MKTVFKMAFAAAALTLAGAWSASAEEVKVGFSPEAYPPFYSQDASGKWGGWEVDITMAICAEAKLDCVLTPIPWDGLIPALKSKKIDTIMNSMSITAEREKEIDFSDKYYNTPTAIIGPKDQKFDATPEGLKGKVIGVQVSTVHAAYAKKHFGSVASEIKEYQTQDEANQDLVAGRIDGAGVRKGDTELKDKINAAIKAIRADGKYAEITKKYFDFDIYGDDKQSN